MVALLVYAHRCVCILHVPSSQHISFVLIKLSCRVQLACVADSCRVHHGLVSDMLLSQTAAFGAGLSAE